jgi:hypothetical protein
MAELKQIIISLKANYIIIIENDLHYVTDAHTIIARYCIISEFQRLRLLASLISLGKIDTAKRIEDFRIAFCGIQHNVELQRTLLPEELAQYLDEIEAKSILPMELIVSLNKDIQEQSVNDAFLMNGIFILDDKRYDVLLSELFNVPGVELTYYRSRPVPSGMEIFLEELRYGLLHTGSTYYIAVVDKMLGEGQEESGKSFIEVDLIELNKTNHLKCLAFLFTSQATIKQPSQYNDYFVREIQKGSQELVEIIASYLTDSSYASVFKYFEENYVNASFKALSMALKNQQNVKHVIKKSINEGISPFESVRGWFDQIVQHNIDESQIDTIDYYSSLTKFFNSQSLIDHTGIKDYGPDLERLNSFELFDLNINRKGLPIFPGDIFWKDGDYYILIGQVCDLLIRDTGRRGAKVAEFLKLKVNPFPEEDQEKFTVSVDKNGKKNVLIQHFYDSNIGSYGVANVEITSRNIYYGDFSVLDLCYYNSGGISELNVEAFEDYKKVPWVTIEKYAYLEKLLTYFSENKNALIANKALVNTEVLAFSSSDIIEENTNFVFGIKRVARLKGRFYDSLYQQVINYKARIDLNLIDYAVVTTTSIDLKVKFAFVETTEKVKVTLTRVKSQKNSINGREVADAVSEFLKVAVQKHETFIEGNNSRDYLFIEDEENYLLEIPLKYADKDNKIKTTDSENIRFARLFKDKLEIKSYTMVDNSETGELNEEGEISLMHIQRGIKLLQNKITLIINDGTVEKKNK